MADCIEIACRAMDGGREYLDSIFIGRLWRSLKQKAVYLQALQDSVRAKRDINSRIGFYNV